MLEAGGCGTPVYLASADFRWLASLVLSIHDQVIAGRVGKDLLGDGLGVLCHLLADLDGGIVEVLGLSVIHDEIGEGSSPTDLRLIRFALGVGCCLNLVCDGGRVWNR